MSVRLTVLGKSPSWQDLDGACSGYLIDVGERSLLVDCGSGVFAKLRRHGADERIEAVVISHFHADHVLDVVPFAYALKYGPLASRTRPALHVPPGGRDALRRLCGSWGSETLVEDAFTVAEYAPAAGLAVAGAQLRFRPLPHYVTSNAIEIRADGSQARLVYSADCGPNDLLAPFAHGAQVLLIESTMLDPDPEGVGTDEPSGHLTAAQAGEIGREAGVERLVLTHYSDQLDRDALRARAEETFGRGVEFASEGGVYEV